VSDYSDYSDFPNNDGVPEDFIEIFSKFHEIVSWIWRTGIMGRDSLRGHTASSANGTRDSDINIVTANIQYTAMYKVYYKS